MTDRNVFAKMLFTDNFMNKMEMAMYDAWFGLFNTRINYKYFEEIVNVFFDDMAILMVKPHFFVFSPAVEQSEVRTAFLQPEPSCLKFKLNGFSNLPPSLRLARGLPRAI